MEIKKNLKSLDVKISKLATDLGISRPTLDTYIDYFENGKPIPNEGYQKIFEYLFSNGEMNSIEFAQKYDYVKRVMLNDAKTRVERSMTQQREELLSNRIRELINSNKIDKPLLEFVNLFINNQDNSLVHAIYMYFNFTNGYEDMMKAEIDEIDKALYSNLSKLFEDYKMKNIQFNEEYYKLIINKNQNLFERKKAKPTQLDIINYIKSNLDDGTELDVEALKQMIATMEDK